MNTTINNSNNAVQSVGGVVYVIIDGEPRFLLIKRFSYGKKIERIAPKGKKEIGETDELTCVREISEETGLDINKLNIKSKLGIIDLKDYGKMDKIISYYLVEYIGNPDDIKLQDDEGFMGVHKRADIVNALSLIPHHGLRDLFRQGYAYLAENLKKQKAIAEFENKIVG